MTISTYNAITATLGIGILIALVVVIISFIAVIQFGQWVICR